MDAPAVLFQIAQQKAAIRPKQKQICEDGAIKEWAVCISCKITPYNQVKAQKLGRV
jgi:hypothetical protein